MKSVKIALMLAFFVITCQPSMVLSLPKPSRASLGIAGIVLVSPFIHGLLQKPVTPKIDITTMHIATVAPATNAHTAWSRSSMSSIRAQIRSNSLTETVYVSGDRDLAVYKNTPHGSTDPIFIYSHGWKAGPCETWAQSIGKFRLNGVGFLVGQKYLRSGIINGNMVVFDYPTDSTRSFNIGQETDVECLYKVYEHVVAHNPDAPIVFVGDCKGATAVLRLITHPAYTQKITHVKGVVLESPPLSMNSALRQMSSYIPSLQRCIYPILNAAAKAWLPAYRSQGDCRVLFSLSADSIPKDLPIYIGSITHDIVAAHEKTEYCISELQKTGNPNVYLCATQEALNHARINQSDSFVNGANAFLKNYNLSHDPKRAVQGEHVLKQARINALNAQQKNKAPL